MDDGASTAAPPGSAARAGMRESAISRLERGQRDPRLTTIVRLAGALDTTPAALIR
jgi:transcriptional regulator with XRE-family HTH domain